MAAQSPISAVRAQRNGYGDAMPIEFILFGLMLAGIATFHRHVLPIAAAGLVVAGRSTSLEDGLQLAAGTIDSGAAAVALDRMVTASQEAAAADAAAR